MVRLPERIFAEQKHRPAFKLLPRLLIVATAWLGSGGVGTGQPADMTPGRVEGSSDVLSLGTSAIGTIAEMLVTAGDRVQAGQHLVRVECGNVERELEARKSDLAAAEAAYLRVLHGPRPEEINIGIANVNLADARLHEAERAYQRTQQLHEGFTVTRVQIDQAERDARMATALLDEVHAKLALLKAGSREEDITEARSRRDAAKSRVDETAARLGYCSVDAPIGGIVLATNVSPGQLVSPTVPVTLLTMVDDSKRRVRAYVDEREIAKVCPRERARMSADGAPGMQFDGVVETVGAAVVENPFANNASRQFRQVMLSVPDNAQPIPIGLRVSVQFSACPAGQRGAK
jgi:membrane fusion protein PltH